MDNDKIMEREAYISDFLTYISSQIVSDLEFFKTAIIDIRLQKECIMASIDDLMKSAKQELLESVGPDDVNDEQFQDNINQVIKTTAIYDRSVYAEHIGQYNTHLCNVKTKCVQYAKRVEMTFNRISASNESDEDLLNKYRHKFHDKEERVNELLRKHYRLNSFRLMRSGNLDEYGRNSIIQQVCMITKR